MFQRVMMVCGCAALAAIGCSKDGGKGAGKSVSVQKPEQMVEVYVAARNAKDVDTMWALYSSEARKQSTKIMRDMIESMPPDRVKAELGLDKAAALKLEGRALLAAAARADRKGQRPRNPPAPKNVEADVSGDKAKVRFDDGTAKCRMDLVKENGAWRLAKFIAVACRQESDKSKPPLDETGNNSASPPPGTDKPPGTAD